MHVLIIGAGTGGLALAHALKGKGVEVSVFERDRTPNPDTGGYRVGISPAGSRALKACVPPENYDLFVATAARAPRYFNMLTEQLSEVLCFELPTSMDGEQNVIRKTLRRVLLTGLEAHVHFGRRLLSYSHNADGSVTAYFEDGSSASGDVLVGADGSNSAVRKQRLPEARIEETGMVALGGKLPMTPLSKALLSDKMFYGMSMIMAPLGFGAIIHSLEFAQHRESVDFAARWPHFVDALDEDSIGWALWGARQNFHQDPLVLNGPDLQRLALRLTEDWHPHFRELIRMTTPEALSALAVRTSVPVPPWETSTVTLLGDAIHTMTPGRGAGANTALRDAALLAELLIDADCRKMSLIQAIHDYEVEMRRYSYEAVKASKQHMSAADSIHKPVIGRLQLSTMRGAMRTVNAIPSFKRHALKKIMSVRGEN